jgi:hypothetical protein
MRDLAEKLVAELKPIRRRNVGVDLAVFAALCAAELVVWLMAGMTRPDLVHAAETIPTFWWKVSGALVLALIGAVTAITSLNPVNSPRRGLASIGAAFAAFLSVGCLVVAMSGFSAPVERLEWRAGVDCVVKLALLSIPPMVALGLLMRRGAPTNVNGTALACGVAAAGWAAFVFMLACPHDDPLYIAVWYTAGCSVSALATRAILPRLARW